MHKLLIVIDCMCVLLCVCVCVCVCVCIGIVCIVWEHLYNYDVLQMKVHMEGIKIYSQLSMHWVLS